MLQKALSMIDMLLLFCVTSHLGRENEDEKNKEEIFFSLSRDKYSSILITLFGGKM
jgi:hypothetical protein